MTDTELMERERRFWFGDGDFYRSNLADDCRMAFPDMGLVDREAAIAGIEAGARWDEVEMKEAQVRRLAPDALLVSYRALARQANFTYEALIGSVYVLEEDDVWRLAYHQHSPEQSERAANGG